MTDCEDKEQNLSEKQEFISEINCECMKLIEPVIIRGLEEYGDKFDFNTEDHWLWIAGLNSLGEFCLVFKASQERWKQNHKRNRGVNYSGFGKDNGE